MKSAPIRPTPEQRVTIEYLKRIFSESGYVICRVAKQYRRHELDFIAVHGRLISRFFIVRPTPKGWVSITPFARAHIEDHMRHKVKHGRSTPARKVFWRQRQLTLPPGTNGWADYFPPEMQARIKKAA